VIKYKKTQLWRW